MVTEGTRDTAPHDVDDLLSPIRAYVQASVCGDLAGVDRHAPRAGAAQDVLEAVWGAARELARYGDHEQYGYGPYPKENRLLRELAEIFGVVEHQRVPVTEDDR